MWRQVQDGIGLGMGITWGIVFYFLWISDYVKLSEPNIVIKTIESVMIVGMIVSSIYWIVRNKK
jgi:hypothetical protein